jgi:hypothetical protein
MNSTYFVWGDDPQKDFNNLTTWRAWIPDWTLQVSGVEKILFFSNFAQNISIDHGHSSKYTENLSLNLNKEFKPTNQTFGNNWQAGFKIPLPVWPFKGKTFKNEINFNLTFDSSNNQTFQRQFGQDKFEEKQNNSNWKIRPSATYRFSKRIQGSLFYERGTQENKITGKYTYNEFGITVNIAIRD